MPALQGLIAATWQDMVDVFGQPEQPMRWKLDGGTILHDAPETAQAAPSGQAVSWEIHGWSPAAVDQVIGIAARVSRFAGFMVSGRSAHQTVGIMPAPVMGRCGHVIVMLPDGWYVHRDNPEILGCDDEDVTPRAAESAV